METHRYISHTGVQNRVWVCLHELVQAHTIQLSDRTASKIIPNLQTNILRLGNILKIRSQMHLECRPRHQMKLNAFDRLVQRIQMSKLLKAIEAYHAEHYLS